MKRVYIAGPISKGILLDNIQQADAAMAELMRAGFAVFNPMLSVYAGGADYLPCTESHPMPSRVGAYADRQASGEFRQFSHQQWLDMDFAWVSVSDAVLRLPGESKGADMETRYAEDHKIPVFHSTVDLIHHFSYTPALG